MRAIAVFSAVADVLLATSVACGPPPSPADDDATGSRRDSRDAAGDDDTMAADPDATGEIGEASGSPNDASVPDVVTDACVAGEARCASSEVALVCLDDGSMQTTVCRPGTSCVDGACVAGDPTGCAEGTLDCRGAAIARCNGEGQWVELADCPGECRDGACEPVTATACDAVDVLFVVDNSASMGPYQAALALAFPRFARSLSDLLPATTSVRLGVTSTEMAHSTVGELAVTEGTCTFTGDGGLSETAFHVSPVDRDTGVNGAQGRLFRPPGSSAAAYAEFSAGDLDSVRTASEWFGQAVRLGEDGSSIEMLAAPIRWALDDIHNGPGGANEGFLRDEGAVLLLFFLQDEPDQTPPQMDGRPSSDVVVDAIVEARRECGGLRCVIAAGFLPRRICEGQRPIDGVLGALPQAPIVASLPSPDLAALNPGAAAVEMNEVLTDALAAVVAAKCAQIDGAP